MGMWFSINYLSHYSKDILPKAEALIQRCHQDGAREVREVPSAGNQSSAKL